jgi:hypothetical protein
MSPLWWLNKLYGALSARQAEMQLMDSYYRGDHPLPFLTKAHDSKMHDEFRLLLEDSRANFMRLVVDATEERLKVDGFRLSAETDAVADKDAWKIWQANKMDAESQSAFIEALVKGLSYLSVWAPPKGSEYASIAVEDPTETIVSYVPGSNYRQRAAALKVWTDDWTGLRRADVYLPDAIYKFQAKQADDNGPATATSAALDGSNEPKWLPLAGGKRAAVVKNPLGIVPIIPLRNRPRLLVEGESEIADVYRIQNGINGFLFLLALAGYFGAHKQRWAVGLKIMVDANGKQVEPWDLAVDKMLVLENPDAKFGEFSATDLVGYIKAIEQKVLHLAVTTRTPRHYLIQEGQSPSGDAIKSAESGLVKKVERKQRPFGEGLEEAIRLARLFQGAPDAPVDSEIVWADAATETEATRTDAVIKQHGAGLIPTEMALEKLGYTQTEIARMMAMRAGDTLLAALLNPVPPEPVEEPAVV